MGSYARKKEKSIGKPHEFPLSSRFSTLRRILARMGRLKYNRLLKHYNVLSLLFVLLVGTWAIFDFQQKSRRFPDSRLRELLRYLIFYNLMELEVFLLVYFDSNLTPAQWIDFSSWYKGVDWPLRTLLILGLYIYLYKAIAWLRGRKLPRWVIPGMSAFAVILAAWFFLAMRFPAYMPRSPYLSYWNLLVWPLLLLLMVWLILLLSKNREGAAPDGRRAGRAFAWMFLARIPFQIGLGFINAGKFAFWYITLSLVLILFTNLIPFLWFKLYFLPWAGTLAKIIGARVDLPSLQKKYGLSAREMEILNLMIDGKSYKEMAEALFISIHTVKSHAYSLYRKLNVNNRHQLIHLVSIAQRDGA
jgi:DNA-binding CsgD family transcriptional regulator